MATQQRIGFIGIGTMGRPMSTNLVKAGRDVTVFDVVPAATEPGRRTRREARRLTGRARSCGRRRRLNAPRPD
ncbi:MAG: hypothetical protein HY329_24880 [Chloroflexi bacterium]|nr:hypothetical protein [Chloroflexota bacterium]